MKRIFGFGKAKKEQLLSASDFLPTAAGGYQLRQKDLGKLHRAAALGDLAQVQKELKKHGIDQRDKAQRTALHLASANGHVDVVKYLVVNKCKLNLVDNEKRSPLMKAVQCQQEECVTVLLEHGADSSLLDADGNTALHLAVLSANTCVTGLLLQHKANIDPQNKEGCTPLILAVSRNHEEIVKLLLKKGANVHARDQCGRTPLMNAAAGGELNLVKLLIRYGADVSHQDTKGWTAEDHATMNGYLSVSKQLAKYVKWNNAGEASADVLSVFQWAEDAGFTYGAPAVDRGGMQHSPNQTSRTGKSRKAVDVPSQEDSISSEAAGSEDTWHTSEEELDFASKQVEKPNLVQLLSASWQFQKKAECDGSRIESLKSPKKSLKQRPLSNAKLAKRESGGVLNQDVSAASNLEEEEGEDDDEENDSGDDKEEEDEEEGKDLTQDEKEEGNVEDEETQTNDILEDEWEEETEPKGEINTKFEHFCDAKHEGEDWCGTGDVCNEDKMNQGLDENVEESVDTPMSFIAGCYEELEESITAMSPKLMNNKVSCKSVPKQPVFQNLNNLLDTQESWNRKRVVQEKFHRSADLCFAGSEMTNEETKISQPLKGTCSLKEKQSSFGKSFENGSSRSAVKTPRLESQIHNSVVDGHVCDKDSEDMVGAEDKVCEAVKEKPEKLCSDRCDEDLREVFNSRTEEECCEKKDEEKKQKKEDTVDSHQVHSVSKDTAGVMPVVAAEEEEDESSPWDSEPECGSLLGELSDEFLPGVDGYGMCSLPVSGKHDNGESSGSGCHMSSSVEEGAIKDVIENSKVRKEKSKQNRNVVTEQEDSDQLNTTPVNVPPPQMKHSLTVKKDCLKTENENAMEDTDKKNFSSEGRSKFMKMRRPAVKKGKSEENKVSIQMDVTDYHDSTQSSDTTSKDVKLLTPAYEEAMALLQQLHVDHAGSAVLLKIQNILLEYDQKIVHEKNQYIAVQRELRKLESETKSLQLVVEETKDWKSVWAHQEREWKSDIQSLKCTLKQEEEKRMAVEALYEKTKETLRRKEDQYSREMEKKEQLELHSRNLEMELVTLKKLLKQVEEERDETQRWLSEEKSARALQEEMYRQKELEDVRRRTLIKNSEESDTEREKHLLYKHELLQHEVAVLRLELDQVKCRHQEAEGKYLEEIETLKEKNQDFEKELKLNEDAFTQTVFQYDGQLNLLKAECAVLTSKLEQTKESKDRLEKEMESVRSRLNTAVQELEHHQSSKSDMERTFQREREEWLRLQDKLLCDLSDMKEANKTFSQQLSKAENQANIFDNELHQLKQTLREKTLRLEMTEKELSQAQCQAKECNHARQLEKDEVNKLIIKQESMQERLAHLQSENLLLRQQLEDVQNKGFTKEKAVNEVQDWFNDIVNKLRADAEKQAYLSEERNKELNARCTDLREQVFKYETDKVEREGMVRQLQQELANALKKQSMSEASLEVAARCRGDLEVDKLHLQKELEQAKTKLQELEEQRLQSEYYVLDLKTALDSKEREVTASSQKVHDLLMASSGTSATVKHLEEHVQRLEIESARLEATVHQQSKRIEVLQRDLQASAMMHKQNVPALTSKDLNSMWEESSKSRSHYEERIAQLDREKAELLEKHESERKEVNKLVESKHLVEERLEQEMKKNIEVQQDCNRLKKLLNRTGKKLQVLRTKETELSQHLEMESNKCARLEAENEHLRKELFVVRGSNDKLQKSKCRLKEEVVTLKSRLETGMVDPSQMEQYRREVEERASQELAEKLQQVNIFLQVHAASQDRIEQIRADRHASLSNQLEQRIGDLEYELDKIRNTEQDSLLQKESTRAEVERYKMLHVEEAKMRSSLAKKLERANEKLSEANARLLHERRRNQSLLLSSSVIGGLTAGPVWYATDLGQLGNSLSLNRNLCLSSTANALTSTSSIKAYVAKVRQELDEKTTKILEEATAEIQSGPPVGPSETSHDDQDPLKRAVKEYHDVLTKNYMI